MSVGCAQWFHAGIVHFVRLGCVFENAQEIHTNSYISVSTSGGETINVGVKQIRIALHTHIRTHTHAQLRVICNLCLKSATQ